MALRFIAISAISAISTALSFVGLQFCTDFSLSTIKSDGVAGWNLVHLDNANQYTELPLGLYTTIGLLANCITNVFILLNLCLTAMFFTELYSSETRKLIERLIYYVVYKGTFLPLIVPPTVYHAGLWSTWLAVLCSLKMFQALARDRLERLNASPSATPWTYLRVYSALLFVFLVDAFWIRLCLAIYTTHRSSLFLLLLFEPFSIAFETLQAILVHGFQLVDIWSNNSDCRRPKLFDKLTAGSLLEWKGILIRNLGFFLDMATFFMALGHYLYIWRLHGMAFHLVDAVLFLNIRALLSAILNRVKGFIKLRIALGALNAALPDATTEELRAYDDECAICREPMAKAKKLNCNHLFHLACLRSWLDQGLTDIATAVAEEVAKGPTTKLVVGASSHGIFTSKQKGLSAKASICTMRFCTVYAVSKRKLPIRPSDIHIDECIVHDYATETSFSSNSSSKFTSISRTDSRSVASFAHMHSSYLSTQKFQPLSSINKTRLSKSSSITKTNHSRTWSLDIGRENTAMSSARSSDYARSRSSSCKSIISDPASWVYDQNFTKDVPLATELPSRNRQANINLELEKLRIKLRHAQGMHVVAQSENFDALRKLNELSKKRSEESMKLKEIIAKEEMAKKLANYQRRKYEAAAKEAECLKECAEREPTERKEVELKAIHAAKEKVKLKDALSGSSPRYRKFTWDEIMSATSSFSDDLKIGMGAYGTVYKCSLYHTTVAVKVLHSSGNH